MTDSQTEFYQEQSQSLVRSYRKREPKWIARKILLADDELVGREVVTALLERNGHQVTAVEDGVEVLEALQNGTFDILLGDISMPFMDGTEVARIIRSGEREGIDRMIPIIALSAHVFPQDREYILSFGINDYIAKPVNFEELLRLIEEVCSNVTTSQLMQTDCMQTTERSRP